VASLPVALRFLERLAAAAGRVRDERAQLEASVDLAEPRRQALDAIAAHGSAGCSQTELAAALGLAESSVCVLVDRLQEAGFLYRFRSKSDRRKSLLLLTQQGADRRDAARSATEALVSAWLSEVDDAELERFGDWLDRLVEATSSPAVVESSSSRLSIQSDLEAAGGAGGGRRTSAGDQGAPRESVANDELPPARWKEAG